MQAEKTPDVVEVTSGMLHTSCPKPALTSLTADSRLTSLVRYTAAPASPIGSEKEERWLVRKLGKAVRQSDVCIDLLVPQTFSLWYESNHCF